MKIIDVNNHVYDPGWREFLMHAECRWIDVQHPDKRSHVGNRSV